MNSLLIKKIFIFITALSLLGAIFSTNYVAVLAIDANDLFVNTDPSFEKAGGGWPVTQTSSDKVTGTYSGTVAADYSHRFFGAALSVNKQYTFSIWVKTLSQTNAQINLNYVDGATDGRLKATISVVGGPDAFKKYSVTFTTPAELGLFDGYNQLSVSFYTNTSFLIDDISLIDSDYASISTFSGAFKTSKINNATKSLEFESSVPTVAFKAVVNSEEVPVTSKMSGLIFTIDVDLSKYHSGDYLEITASYNGPLGLIDGVNYQGGSDVIKTYLFDDDPVQTPPPTALTPPTINTITNTAKSISGKSKYDGIVTVTIGTKPYETLVKATDWKVSIDKPLIAGTKVIAIVSYDDRTSKPSSKIVIPATPTLKAVKGNSIYVKGTATKGSWVYAKIGNKTYSVKSSSTGSFTIKIAKIKKGTAISVRCKSGSQYSESKLIRAY